MRQNANNPSRRRAVEEIEELLGGLFLDEFFEIYWQRKPYLCRPGERVLQKYLSVEELDRILSNTALPINQVTMGKRATGVPFGQYQRGSYAEPNSVLDLFAKGESLIIRAMHLWSGGLAHLVDVAGQAFDSGAQANVYLTPSGGQSSTPHWDAHDIFVLQIAGEKTWDIHSSKLPLPLTTYEFYSSTHPVGEKIDEITVRAGDLVYIPRGMVHNPRAVTNSMHIALGVQIITVFDVLNRALRDSALEHVEMRQGLVTTTDGTELKASLKVISQSLDKMHSEQKLLDAMSDLIRERRTGRRIKTLGRLQSLFNEVGLLPLTQVQLMDGYDPDLRFISETTEGEVRIGTKRFSFTAGFRSAFEHALSGQTFCPSDLPLESVELQLAFVERLIKEGVLKLVCKLPDVT